MRIKSVLVLLALLFSANVFAADPISLAYVTSGSAVMPDANRVTHINYAFGTVKPTFDGVFVQNPQRLHQIVGLKAQNPKLKVMLSIGGWTAGGFSEMARDRKTRAAFVEDCARVVDEFKLDGVDLDWEYPSSSAAGITALPEDTDNFTALMRELRAKLGRDKLLTFASVASGDYVDFAAVMPFIDFVNIMAYDMGTPPAHHHSALYPSANTRFSSSQAVEAHIAKGVDPQKLTLGVPFYGHGDVNKGVEYFIHYREKGQFDDPKYTHKWDDVCKVPYVVDESGDMVYAYDNAESLRLKCDYAKQKQLLGVMYWDYSCDDAKGTLRDAVYYSFYPEK